MYEVVQVAGSFRFQLFFMSPICFLISRNSFSRRAVLSSGSLEDRAERSGCLDEWSRLSCRSGCLDDLSGRSGCLDDRSGFSGCLDDRVVLAVLCWLGGTELPALSTLCLLRGGVLSTSPPLRRVT
jgi:hypothetical protein